MTVSSRVLYDRDGAAEQLSTSARRVDDLRRARLLLAVRDGREWKYTAMELQRYAESLPSSESV
ncbi:hypothetical protein [Mycobacteroides abscessus]|uniref:hypothetical protein n=1 Tax=Mycobacteroides abscessus TaxID=36809 RepID=UPI000C25D8D5|nr:hypothetical protein [Mycobacteroides abscessus]